MQNRNRIPKMWHIDHSLAKCDNLILKHYITSGNDIMIGEFYV